MAKTAEKKKPGCFAILLSLCLLMTCLSFGLVKMMSAAGTAKTQSKPSFTVDKSESAQVERKTLLEELVSKGAVQKYVQRGQHVEMWVTPLFLALDFDQKKAFAECAWCYYFDAGQEFNGLNIHNSKTGKKIGNFNPHSGLDLN